jgi:transcriptional regulator with XRE-family HTH domain
MNEQTNEFTLKLNQLFEERRKPNGKRYTQTEFIRGIDGMITRVYLWKLRTGRATNPSYDVLKAIAGFFDVEVSYFFVDNGDEILSHIVKGAAQLDETRRRQVQALVEQLLAEQQTDRPGPS